MAKTLSRKQVDELTKAFQASTVAAEKTASAVDKLVDNLNETKPEKIDKVAKKFDSVAESIEDATKNLADFNKDAEKLVDFSKNLKGKFAQGLKIGTIDTKAISAFEKRIKDLQSLAVDTRKKFGSALGKAVDPRVASDIKGKLADALSGSVDAKAAADLRTKFSDAFSKAVDPADATKVMDEYVDALLKAVDPAKAEGPVKTFAQEMEKVADPTKVDAIKSAFDKNFKEIDKAVADFSSEISQAGKQVTDFEKAVQEKFIGGSDLETVGRTSEQIGQSVSQLTNLFGALGKGPGAFIDQMKKAKESSLSLKLGAEYAGKLGVACKGVGAAAGIMGKALSAALGPIGLIVMAVSGIIGAVINAAMAVDKYIKDMNKDFASIRGPNLNLSSPNITKQFNDFNLAITSIGDNLRDGLDPKQVYSFMASVNAAGKNISSLNTGIYGYRDAVQVAAKASKVFGMDMVAVGALQGKMAAEYRMTLDQISDAYVQVAFDASKSGLSTDRFWTAVENASVGLSFYGKFIGAASKNLKNFTEAQIAGAKESEDASTEVTQSFKKMTLTQRLAVAQMSGKEVKEAFKKQRVMAEEALKKSETEATEIYANLQEEKDPERQAILKKQYDAAIATRNSDKRMLEKIDATIAGGTAAMANNMAMVSGQTNNILIKQIKKSVKGNLSLMGQGKDQINALIANNALAGISEDTTRMLIEQVKNTGVEIEGGISTPITRLRDANIKGNTDLANKIKAGMDGAANLLKDIKQINGEDAAVNAQNVELNKKSVGTLANLLGISDKEALTLINTAATSKAAQEELTAIYAEAAKGSISDEQIKKRLDKLKQLDAATNATMANNDAIEETKEAQKVAYDKQFEAIRDNTLSFEDMKNITEAGFKTIMATRLSSIDAGITDLVAHFLKGETRQDKALKAMSSLDVALVKGPKDIMGKIDESQTKVVIEREKGDTGEIEKTKKEEGDTGDIVSPLEAIAKLTKMSYNITKKGGKLDTVNNKVQAAQKALAEAGNEQDKKNAKKLLKEAMEEKAVAEAQLKKNDAIIQGLKDGKLVEEDMASYMALLALNVDPKDKDNINKVKNVLGMIVAKKFKGASTVSEADLKKLGAEGDIYIQKAKDTGTWDPIKKEFNINYEAPKAVKSDKGIKSREEIDKPGAIVLHKGEGIEPATTKKSPAEPKMDIGAKIGAGMTAGIKDFMGDFAAMANAAGKVIIPSIGKIATATGSKEIKKIGNDLQDLIQESVDFWKLTVDEQKKLEKAGAIGQVARTATSFAGDVASSGGVGGVGKAGLKGVAKLVAKDMGKEAVKYTHKETAKKKAEEATEIAAKSKEPAPVMAAALPPLPPKLEIPFFDMKAKKPKLAEPAPVLAAAGAGAGQTITINVNATEKDLAQRIANEIRGVLYRDKVNNLG